MAQPGFFRRSSWPALATMAALLLLSSLHGAHGASAQWPTGTYMYTCTNNTITPAGDLAGSCAFRVQVKSLDPAPGWYSKQVGGFVLDEARNKIIEIGVEHMFEGLHGLAKNYFFPSGKTLPGYETVYPAGGQLPAIEEASEADEAAEGVEDLTMEGAVDDAAVEATTSLADGVAAAAVDVLGFAAEAIEPIGLAFAVFNVGKLIFKIVKHVEYENSYLTGYLQTSINMTYCSAGSSVSNYGGILQCSGWNVPAGGTYFNSCTNIAYNTNTAFVGAACNNGIYFKNTQGQIIAGYNASTINTTFCAGKPLQLTNYGGVLTCTNGINHVNGLLGGSWTQSCSPQVLTGLSPSGYNMLGAKCYNNPLDITWINLAMCSPTATMTQSNGLLICSTLATSGPMVPPGGSWYQSCSPISFKNNVLTAYCGLTFQNGTAKMSKININECSASSRNNIIQAYGQLQCYGASSNLPGGIWSKSCTAKTYVDNFLQAYCGLPNGVTSNVNMNLCGTSASLTNKNNVLTCSQIASPTPGGIWWQSCAPQYFSPKNGLLVATCAGTGQVTSSRIGIVPSYINVSLCSNPNSLAVNNNLVICQGGANLALPGGTWSLSCSPLVWNTTGGQKTLTAVCSNPFVSPPTPVLVGLNYSLCAAGSSLSQQQGMLICNAMAQGTPGGSWYQSCSPISYQNNILTATCMSPGSKLTVSSIDTSYCITSGSYATTIINVAGQLACQSPIATATAAGLPTGVPLGNWQTKCSFVSLKNGLFRALCGLPNNQASSINLTLCAPPATVSVNGNTLVCSAVASGLPVGAYVPYCGPLSWNNGILMTNCAGSFPQTVSTQNTNMCAGSPPMLNEYGNQLACLSGSALSPAGSWIDSCAAAAFNSTTGIMTAMCSPGSPPKGQSPLPLVSTSLNVSLCATGTTVYNNGGLMMCGSSFTAYNSLPAGTWAATCAPYTMTVNNILMATCKTNDPPNQSFSMLDITGCPGYGFGSWTVMNDDGSLVCSN